MAERLDIIKDFSREIDPELCLADRNVNFHMSTILILSVIFSNSLFFSMTFLFSI